MKAEDMVKRTKEALLKSDEIKHIMQEIENAADEGKFKVEISGDRDFLNDEQRKYLEILGYGLSYDQYLYKWTIYWDQF